MLETINCSAKSSTKGKVSWSVTVQICAVKTQKLWILKGQVDGH